MRTLQDLGRRTTSDSDLLAAEVKAEWDASHA